MTLPDSWPLSATATQLLRAPKTDKRELLKLAFKELVLRRVWRLERQERRLGRDKLHLHPGDRPAPDLPPLRLLDAKLRFEINPGEELAKAVRKVGGDIADVVRADAREELARRGLVDLHRRKVLGLIPHTKVTLTASGESWRAGSYEREELLEDTLRGDRSPASLVPQAAALGGLVLLLDPAPLAELDDALGRLREDEAAWYGGASADGGAGAGAGAEDLDLSALDGLDLGLLDAIGDLGSTFDGAFDSAVDAGSGGDGGGGGGDGGGGGS